MPAEISGNVFAKCFPSYSTDVERCGGLTLCNISPTTEDELASIYKDGSDRFRIVGALLQGDFMGKACNVKQNGMYDWIMACKRELGSKRIGRRGDGAGRMSVEPFLMMDRKHPINNQYWTVTNGVGGSGTAPNGNSYDYTCTVESQTGIKNDPLWFHVSMNVFIQGQTAGGTGVYAAYQIVDAVAGSGNQITIYATGNNSNSFLSAPQVVDVAEGVMTRGTPNVNDYEKYCHQIPGLNTTQTVPFWIKSTRYTICNNELVQKFIQQVAQGNPYYEKFLHVPDVELNRQIIQDFQERHAWDFWFAKALPNQTLTLWDQLEQITAFSDDSAGNYLDMVGEGACIGRRAEAIGMYELHAECGRVRDLQGDILNIQELQVALYDMQRVREANGMQSEVFECYTDSFYAVQFQQGMIRYFKDRSEGLLRLNLDLSSKVEQNALGFKWCEYQLDYPACKLRCVTHKFFDDYVSAMKTASASLANVGTFFWIFDWGTNYQGVIESNAVNNQSGNVSDYAKVNEAMLCVMKTVKQGVRNNSLSYTNVSECPGASLLMSNINRNQVPEHAGSIGETDYYGNYS